MNAKTKIIALACSALLALTGTASAHHGANNTKVYAGKVTGTTAATDPATAIRGRALLVDGASKNLLAVKVRNLKPNTAYTFGLDGVADFAATTATTDENGKLNGFVKSDTFNAADGTTYTVVAPSLTETVYVAPSVALNVSDVTKPLSLPFSSVVAVVGAKSLTPSRAKLYAVFGFRLRTFTASTFLSVPSTSSA